MNINKFTKPSTNTLWFLLFYDVVLAAAFGQTTHFYSEHPTWSVMGFVLMCNLFLYVMWMLTSLDLITNSKNNVTQKLFGLIQIISLSLAAITLGWDSDSSYFWGFLSLAISVLSLIGLITASDQRAYARSIIPGLALTTIVFTSGVLLTFQDTFSPERWAVPLFALGLLSMTVSTLISGSKRFAYENKISTHDLQERSGMLLLIILGEAFIVLVDSLAAAGTIPQPAFFVLSIVVVFAIWLLYFPQLAQFSRPETLRSTVSRFGAHFLLVMCSANAAAAYVSQTLIPQDFTLENWGSDNWTALPLVFIVLAIMWLEYLDNPRWRMVQSIHAISAVVIAFLVLTSEANNSEWGGMSLALSALVLLADAIVCYMIRARDDQRNPLLLNT
jgi:low temperature requirement protein LtrA